MYQCTNNTSTPIIEKKAFIIQNRQAFLFTNQKARQADRHENARL